MNELEVRAEWSPHNVEPVGTLVEDGGQVYFSWHPAFEHDLSPYGFPLSQQGLVAHSAKPGVPLPGLFNDARPDGWSLLLLHRAFQGRGLAPSSIGVLEELAFVGKDGIGALTFHPASGGPLSDAVDLAGLARHALDAYDGTTQDVLPALVRAGGSPGGARPKVLVAFRNNGSGVRIGNGDDEEWEPWLVKFRARHESPDTCRREHAWLSLARLAGLKVPDSRVLDLNDEGDAIAIRRFDRFEGRRVHILSAAGALNVDFRTAMTDYRELLRLCAFICRGDMEQMQRLVRLAAFNVLFCNEDDHLKNLAFLYEPDIGWRLSPAYDLTYCPRGGRSTTVMGEGQRVTRADLEALGNHAGLRARDSQAILDDVRTAATRVDEVLDEVGCADSVSREAAQRVQSTAAAW